MVRYCMKCGTKQYKDSEFCVKCGNKIDQVSQPKSSPQVNQPQAYIPSVPAKVSKNMLIGIIGIAIAIVIIIVVVFLFISGGVSDTISADELTGYWMDQANGTWDFEFHGDINYKRENDQDWYDYLGEWEFNG